MILERLVEFFILNKVIVQGYNLNDEIVEINGCKYNSKEILKRHDCLMKEFLERYAI